VALDQSALIEVLDALKAAEVDDRIRQAAQTIYQAHQPFQEVPDQWNARVDAFWREVKAQGGRSTESQPST
jgi:hypothetical protein